MAAIILEITACIEPDDDGFHVYVPMFKGLHTCGDTEEEALKHAKHASIAYVRSLIKHGDPIPIGIVNIEVPAPKSKSKTKKKQPEPDMRQLLLQMA